MMYPRPPEPKPDSLREPSGSAQLAAERILTRLDCLSDDIARIIDEAMDQVVAAELADAAARPHHDESSADACGALNPARDQGPE